MINQEYVNWLVSWIQNGTINIKTGKPFEVGDILNADYKTAVINAFKAEVVAGTITTDQFQTITGQVYAD